MRLPVPNNKLVAFTLAGALLTAVVAGALAAPLGGLAGTGEDTADADVTQQLGGDAPSPNEEFTPEVQTQSTYEEHDEYEDEEYEDDGEEYEDEEYEDDGEEYEDEEYEDDGEEYEDEEYEDDGEEYEDEEYEDDGEEYADEEDEEDEEYER